MSDGYRPRWMRDLERFLFLKPSFVLSGSVTDYQIVNVDGVLAPLAMVDALEQVLFRNGYGTVIAYDPAQGMRPVSDGGDELIQKLGLQLENGRARVGIPALTSAIERYNGLKEEQPIALIIDFAGRTIVRPESLDAAENGLFTQALVGGYRAMPTMHEARPFYNTVIWLVEKEGDLPDWLVVNNACLRHIPVSMADRLARHTIAPSLLRGLGGKPTDDMIADFVDGTEGMLLRDMQAIIQLGKEDRIQPERIRDAVRHFKTGVVDDPWKKIDREKIRNAEQSIRKRLKGQDVAVVHMLDIVKRAITGVGGGKRGGRPRGFALFAGPTGVGKTELAKTITELLFGDENAYIRFDMSEFGAEHADQRLIGAPPGYVGYDQGGQLTNAIRERPHAVLLFDEIEKAHPKLLNLFLQILDDGVLTSGRGDRVYFSEAIIIFTSNLGITKFGEQGHRTQNVSQDDCYETVSASIREEIERYFKFTLGRPEILNRFGENIIVFDFIRPDVGKLIFDGMVDGLLKGMAEDGIDVTLSVDVLEALEEVCLKDLQNGGRGIRNQLEAHFVNPLSRAIFDADVESDAVVVDRIVFGEKATTLMVTV